MLYHCANPAAHGYLSSSGKRDGFSKNRWIFSEVLLGASRVGENVGKVVVDLVDPDPGKLGVAVDQVTDDLLNVALDVERRSVGDADDDTVRTIFLRSRWTNLAFIVTYKTLLKDFYLNGTWSSESLKT